MALNLNFKKGTIEYNEHAIVSFNGRHCRLSDNLKIKHVNYLNRMFNFLIEYPQQKVNHKVKENKTSQDYFINNCHLTYQLSR